MNGRRFLQQNEIFSLLSIFFAVAAIITQRHLAQSKTELREAEAQRLAAITERDHAQKEADRLQNENRDLENQLAEFRKRKPAPKIITLSEDRAEYKFASGKAVLPAPFRDAMEKDIIPKLEKLSSLHNCDTVEIVGHTDEIPLGSPEKQSIDSQLPLSAWRFKARPTSNLDSLLLFALENHQLAQLTPGSNTDLGMMRAVAILQLIRDQQLDGKLKGLKYVVPYSAGHLLQGYRDLATDRFPLEDASRRRIELRLRNSSES